MRGIQWIYIIVQECQKHFSTASSPPQFITDGRNGEMGMNKEKEKSADDDGVVFPFYPRQMEGGPQSKQILYRDIFIRKGSQVFGDDTFRGAAGDDPFNTSQDDGFDGRLLQPLY